MVRALGAVPARVLIVEDNRDICRNIAAYLDKHGYVTDFAHDGISAMRLALTNRFVNARCIALMPSYAKSMT